MTYRIEGLQRTDFAPLFGLSDDELAAHNAMRVAATGSGFPCRIALCDAQQGDSLILVHYVSHDVASPYRFAYAIYLNERSVDAAVLVDKVPPVFIGRPIALRGFDINGMLCAVDLAMASDSDSKIRLLFRNDQVAYIHAHNAAHGCFSAKIERNGQ